MQQKEKNYYLKLVVYTVLGLSIIAMMLGVGYVIFLALFPSAQSIAAFFITYIVPVLIALIILIIILIVLYVALFIGVAVTYLNKPMKVSEKDKKYSIKKAKESGKRQKGSS